MYSTRVSLILAAMILTGALRTVAVKVLYQMGYEKPFFVTLLFHVAGLPAFAVHCCLQRRRRRRRCNKHDNNNNNNNKKVASVSAASENNNNKTTTHSSSEASDVEAPPQQEGGSALEATSTIPTEEEPTPELFRTMGSQTGLSEASHLAAKSLLERTRPRCVQLILPGLLDLFAYLLRWSAVLYVPASVAEMLMNGLELVLSAAASRVMRKRRVSRQRWAGVGIVTAGLLTIGIADWRSDPAPQEDSSSSSSSSSSSRNNNTFVGAMMILGAACVGTALTMAEEILTQEGGFPVLIVMGHEGLWGLLAGLALYYPMAPLFGEDPSSTWQALATSATAIVYSLGLVVLFTLTGMLSILAVAVTSSMTRNMWQHFRSLLVWIIALVIFYACTKSNLGEAWIMPYSMVVLLGFAVMLVGVWIYYQRRVTHGQEG